MINIFTVLAEVTFATKIPSENDIWSPNYHLQFTATNEVKDELITKVRILRKFIEVGKLSRQANFERYADQLFTFLINTESDITGKSKLTPSEFVTKLEKFQYITNDKDDDEEDDEMNSSNMDKFTEKEARNEKIIRKDRKITQDTRRKPMYPLTGKCKTCQSDES